MAMGTEGSSLCGKILMLCYVSETFLCAAQGAHLRRKLNWAVRMSEEESPLEKIWCNLVSLEKQIPAGTWLQHQGGEPLAQARCCGPPWRGKPARASS